MKSLPELGDAGWFTRRPYLNMIIRWAGWLGARAHAGQELSTLDLVSRDGACVLLLDGSEEARAWQAAVEQEVRLSVDLWSEPDAAGVATSYCIPGRLIETHDIAHTATCPVVLPD